MSATTQPKNTLSKKAQNVIRKWEDEAENANYHSMVDSGGQMFRIMAKHSSEEAAIKMLAEFLKKNVFDF